FCLQVNDLRLPPVKALGRSNVIVDAPVDVLKKESIAAREVENPMNGKNMTIARRGAADLERLRTAGYALTSRRDHVLLHCKKAMLDHARCYIVKESLEYEIDRLLPHFPGIKAVVDRFPLTEVLRSL